MPLSSKLTTEDDLLSRSPMTFPFPLDDGQIAKLILPRGGLTKQELDRLIEYLTTLVVAP